MRDFGKAAPRVPLIIPIGLFNCFNGKKQVSRGIAVVSVYLSQMAVGVFINRHPIYKL